MEDFESDLNNAEKKETTWTRLRDQIYFIFGTVGIFWIVEVVDMLSGQKLEMFFGIKPRAIAGIVGIPCAPFLHGDWPHLMANTLPFMVLGGLVIVTSNRKTFVEICCVVIIAAGLGTWLFGKTGTNHIGASSLVFGFLGFLIWRAWFGRKLLWTMIAVMVGLLYGSILLSLFNIQNGISWSGHFFGLVGGGIAAFLHTPKPKETIDTL